MIPLYILNYCTREVHRQHANALYVPGMFRAWSYAFDHLPDFYNPLDGGINHVNLKAMNALIMWDCTTPLSSNACSGYRTTPVTFASGGHASNAISVPEHMSRLLDAIGETELDEWPGLADEFTHHFLKIHPFADGNGRTGSLLRNILLGTLDDPTDLPEYEF